MKVTFRIPTEQFGFVEVNLEVADDIRPSEIVDKYEEIKASYAEKPQNTLSDKEMTDYIFNSLHGIGNNPEIWETMHPLQKQVLKCYRNAKERKAPLKENN